MKPFLLILYSLISSDSLLINNSNEFKSRWVTTTIPKNICGLWQSISVLPPANTHIKAYQFIITQTDSFNFKTFFHSGIKIEKKFYFLDSKEPVIKNIKQNIYALELTPDSKFRRFNSRLILYLKPLDRKVLQIQLKAVSNEFKSHEIKEFHFRNYSRVN